MKKEYVALTGLKKFPGYEVLQELWNAQYLKIQEAMDSAAKRGSETAWRYWAGQDKGFKLAVTQLDRAIEQMEREMDEDRKPQDSVVDKLLAEARGE